MKTIIVLSFLSIFGLVLLLKPVDKSQLQKNNTKKEVKIDKQQPASMTSKEKEPRDPFKYLEEINGKYFYTIQEGDSPWQICRDFAIFEKELRSANAIYFLRKEKNSEKIQPKEKLVIPIIKRKIYTDIKASHYGEGDNFDGKPMANGDIMDKDDPSIIAHRDYPLNLPVKVINPENGRSIIGWIRDRGPFWLKGNKKKMANIAKMNLKAVGKKKVYDRDIDLSAAAAKELGYFKKGTTHLNVVPLNPLTMAKR